MLTVTNDRGDSVTQKRLSTVRQKHTKKHPIQQGGGK
jgi:hypothetical protein